MGRTVPGVSSTVVQNNLVILNYRYAIAYREFSAALFSGGAADG